MKDLKTLSCDFNSKSCTTCANYTMCSLLNTENHLNKLENQIINIFSSLNSLIEFSVENGTNIKEINERIPQKEDIIEEFSLIYNEIEKLRNIYLEGNEELKKLILQYSEELGNISKRIGDLEKLNLPEQGKLNDVS